MKVTISEMKEKINIKLDKSYNSAKTRINKSIDSNKNIINKILYFITSEIATLTNNYKEYYRYSV